MPFSEEELLRLKGAHDDWLSHQPGVTGSGIGLNAGGQVSIKIFTNRMTPGTKTAIQETLAGLPVDFEETGEFRAF